MARTTSYSPQFKAELVLQLLQGREISAISGEYNIHPNVLRRWLKEFQGEIHFSYKSPSRRIRLLPGADRQAPRHIADHVRSLRKRLQQDANQIHSNPRQAL